MPRTGAGHRDDPADYAHIDRGAGGAEGSGAADAGGESDVARVGDFAGGDRFFRGGCGCGEASICHGPREADVARRAHRQQPSPPPIDATVAAPGREEVLVWCCTGVGSRLILAPGDIADVVQLILDAPMPARQREQAFRPRLVSGQAGGGVNCPGTGLAAHDTLACDPAHLRQTGP